MADVAAAPVVEAPKAAKPVKAPKEKKPKAAAKPKAPAAHPKYGDMIAGKCLFFPWFYFGRVELFDLYFGSDGVL